jgi:hypothetical protein
MSSRIDVTAIAWSGGFFDGEGTVRINKGRAGSKSTLGLQIINTDRLALERFRSGVFGLGDINGPYGPYGISKKRTWVWLCNRRPEVVAVIAALWIFLSQRRQEQIITATSIIKT